MNANVEINEKNFCYFLLPRSVTDFWQNALALTPRIRLIPKFPESMSSYFRIVFYIS